MAKKAKASKKALVRAKSKTKAKSIEQYEHADSKRVNNPHIGLVNERTDTEFGQNKKTYQYDPHLDPQLQWAGKAERASFEVPVVSLHVHERIDPKTIIECVRKEREDHQLSLFEKEKKPLREAIEFYKHKEGWANRLIAGDSMLVMNSMLEKEGMGEKVQMIYFDPPYGIRYGSNFQPFTNKRDVKDGSDEDLSPEPEMIKAFRDTWELGIHSYLSYLRDRLFLAKDLLTPSGVVFVQIGDENVHLVRNVLDEIFGIQNFISLITVVKTSSATATLVPNVADYLLIYSKEKSKVKYRQLFIDKIIGGAGGSAYNRVMLPNGEKITVREAEEREVDLSNARFYRLSDLRSQRPPGSFPVLFNGIEYTPTKGYWKTGEEGFKNLIKANRIEASGNTLNYIRYLDDFPAFPITNNWSDLSSSVGSDKVYVVQTNERIVERCLIMSTDPGDLVLDITCGSGTTAFVSENWGRRWITCDTSRIAVALAKQRLMTASFDFFVLARQDEGITAGFQYKTIPHVTLKSIANNEPAGTEVLFDQAKIDSSKARVTGPFTVESIPAPFVRNLDGEEETVSSPDDSLAREGETLRQDQWRDELQRTGVRAKGGVTLHFSRIDAQEGTRYIQAAGETKESRPQKVLIVFGPEHAPLDARVVELAIEEARQLKPSILLFCAFQFDEEAAKDIDETSEKLVGFKLLKAHMNMDMQTEDLKKQRNTNESFWLIGQPDVRIHEIKEGADKGKVRVEVAGFDYYNPKTGAIDSGGSKNIAMWMLDTDYDGRSLFPRQIFFPMAGPKDGWARLAKNLKAEIDEEKIEAFRGTESLPFMPGKRIAVKIIDDRGIESLKIIKR